MNTWTKRKCCLLRRPLCVLSSTPLPSAMYCTQTEVDWSTQTAEAFLASMSSMGSSDALEFLESKGFKAVKHVLRRNRELEVMARVGVSLQRANEQAQKQHSTKKGRRTWQTLLTTAAFGGDKEGRSTMSAERKADAIGVCKKTFNFAVDHAERLQAELHPTEARKGSVYWF